jgi:hypothetical protein
MCTFAELQDSGVEIHRFSGKVLHISHSGIRLTAHWPLPPGLQMLVELPDPDTGLPRSLLLANLVQATAQANDEWELECAFAAQLTDQDLEPFGGQVRGPETPSDLRRFARYACDAPAFYQVLRSFDTQSWPAQIVDISAGGLGMLVGRPLEVGMTLKIELSVTTDKGPLRVVGCVVRFSFVSGREWLVGCNFLRHLSDAELAACRKDAP